MPSSQLKRLKASLREQGVIKPQQSKKQKKRQAQDERAKNEKRLQRGAALESIREQFNPFQFKTNARGPKFAVTSNRPATASVAKGINGRPGVAKSAAEERRRETLLVEMQRKNKVGGIIDRRFGEGDMSLDPEAIMAERFAREKLRSHKKASLFDLEEDEPIARLTHMGMALDDDPAYKDDFDEDDLGSEEESDASDDARKRLKRFREQLAADEGEDDDDELPERKKSKKEVMEEVIKKSKLYKYERQAAKEDDEDLRAELDKELPNLQALLMGGRKGPRGQATGQNGDKSTVIAGVDRATFEKGYDSQVRLLAADKRARPTERTKTEEEKAEEESKRLKELEEKRVKRMHGQKESESEDSEEDEDKNPQTVSADLDMIDADDEDADEDAFGIGRGIKMRATATELGFDDEDDFVIDDDLVASGSDIDSEDLEEDSDAEDEGAVVSDEEDEFTKGLLTEAESKDPVYINGNVTAGTTADDDGLPYTFPCPQTHDDFVHITKTVPLAKLPVVVQRIRALYHPKLDSKHKEKLGNFTRVLIQHIAYLGNDAGSEVYPAAEALIRHVHSLAKMFPIETAKEFRSHLVEMERSRPLSLNTGDLFILTAISSIFPTSDHFHQAVTPAMLSIGRYLGSKVPRALDDYAAGTYLSVLALQYQRLSKRYVPELMNFTLNTLSSLAPEKSKEKIGFFPVHEPVSGMRIKNAKEAIVRKLECSDCSPASSTKNSSTKVALVKTTVGLLAAAAETWTGKAAFYETFQPAVKVMRHLVSPSCRAHIPDSLVQEIERTASMLERMLKVAQLSRRPLELHHHRPLAIKTYVPKFEDTFDPNKHYDPDRDRAEIAKLKAEHKKERKGAMRELRKDANFMARERLRLKKEKDTAYEKKYKKLVAEIQGEEGYEANSYEREKDARRRARKRG